ncbi:MAG: nucleotidyltransferase family protein [Planctomycetes bacterium]|nr:nucleotidyltransferase family protein [Planctomycetota bacterium]
MKPLGPISWERMIRAVEKVRERLMRATAALERAGVPYAVAGGNAVAAWVSRIDEGAARNTRDVDILIRRSDFAAARQILESCGFVYVQTRDVDMFLDGPNSRPSEAVHILYASEKVKPAYVNASPDVDESERDQAFNVVGLEALVRMKLNSNRDKDRTHLRDLIGVGLIDGSWPARFDSPLDQRLQDLLDTPEG